MAKTRYEQSNPLAQQAWDELLFREMQYESFFLPKFAGEGSSGLNSIVHVKTNLQGRKGTKVTFGKMRRLRGAGVTGRTKLEDNEEALRDDSFYVELERYRHAVRDQGDLDRRRPIYDMDAESREAIKIWGSEKLDKLCFDALSDVTVKAPTRVFYYAGTTPTIGTSFSTAKAALTTSSKLDDFELIQRATAWCKTGGNRSQDPIRPIKIGGKSYYVLLVHPDVAADLKGSDKWQQAQRDAMERGKDNPIFTGALGMVDNVVFHEHELVPIGLDAGASNNVPYAHCFFLGAQALAWAWGERPSVVAKKFDYDEENGYAIRMTCKVEKVKFVDEAKDYGFVSFPVARTQISDI